MLKQKDMEIKVRRHLANGKNKGKWQIKRGGCVEYYEPDDVVLILFGCKLVNRRSTAQKIFDGKNKSVCAWVQCSSYIVLSDLEDSGWSALDDATYYDFNPKHHPFWVDSFGDECDGLLVDVLVTDGVQVVNGSLLDTAGLPALTEKKVR